MKSLRSTGAKSLRSTRAKSLRGTRLTAGVLGMLLLLAPIRAAAQTSAESRSSSPSFEAGATVGVVGLFPTFGARVTTVLSPRFALEETADLMPWVLDDRGGTHFVFQGQLRHSFRQGLRGSWHATYGTTFLSIYEYRPASVFPRPDGSRDVVAEQRSFYLDDVAIHVGIGGERRISPRVALRWDLQAMQALRDPSYPWPRATVGITWK